MIDCVYKFRDKSTYFEVTSKTGEPVELPTLTVCFKPCFKETVLEDYNLIYLPNHWSPKSDLSVEEIFEKSTYEIGQDFNLSIAYLSYGGKTAIIDKPTKFNISSSIEVEIRAVVTQHQGKCYKIILSGSESQDKSLVMLFTIKVVLSKNLVSKPKQVMV